ncbi:universal stress protein [Thermoleophilia bacterium SCSIO 60948]|nr:universal stress protein [Thermoleophilia bacterium SCSIO 60948]
MFTRIVAGTDGSPTATEAVRRAIRLASLTGATLELVSAYQPVPKSELREAERDVPNDVRHAIGPRQDVDVFLDAASREAAKENVEIRTHAREGDAAAALIDVAEETGAELIVVGSVGMTGARRFLLGSVPNRVSHHASCDVLVVRTD